MKETEYSIEEKSETGVLVPAFTGKFGIDLRELRPLDLSDRPSILSALEKDSPSCENSAANILMWGSAYGMQMLLWRGRIVLYNPTDGLLRYPLGAPTPPEELSELGGAFSRAGLLHSSYIYDIPSDWTGLYPNASDYFRVLAEHDDADYLYSVSRLKNLEGAKLRKKRNHIKHFLSDNPEYLSTDLSAANLSAARKFMSEIGSERGLYGEIGAIDFGISHFDELGLGGIVLYSKPSEIVGVAVFSRLNASIYTVHFEKSVHEVAGAPQMLVVCEAEALSKLGVVTMNREQDLGDANLRHAKESLDPSGFYRRQRAYFPV